MTERNIYSTNIESTSLAQVGNPEKILPFQARYLPLSFSPRISRYENEGSAIEHCWHTQSYTQSQPLSGPILPHGCLILESIQIVTVYKDTSLLFLPTLKAFPASKFQGNKVKDIRRNRVLL
jgi:hypothetical protein